MFSKLAFAAAIAALFTTTSGHMVMNTPHPYTPSNGPLTNAPLLGDGSDYPCKNRPGVNAYGPAKGDNQMPVGAQQTLSFNGSAVHGGGSCQVSLTTDKAPNKSSTFKVIHSIIGGCPSNTTAGNLPENANGDGANKYFFSIPDDVPNGDYSLAWTWFNKIGNREMYMNCAPVTVTGSKGTPDTFGKLPDMFIANIGAGTAVQAAAKANYIFPNPGNSVETDANDDMVKPVCPPETKDCTTPPGGAQLAPAGAPAAGGSSGGPSAAAPAPASSAGATGPAASGGSGSGSSGAAASPAAQGGSTPAAASPVAAAPAAPATPGVAPPAGSVPCTNPGQVVCIGTSQFGICDITNAAVPQPLAAETHCSNGQIMRKRSPLSGSLMARHAHGNAHAHPH